MTISVTLVSGQSAVVGIASSREAYEVEVSSGIPGPAGVSVESANVIGGMLNLTLSNGAVVNTGSVMGSANTGTITFTGNTIGQLNNNSINIVTNGKEWTFGNDGTFSIPGAIYANGSLGSNGQVLTSTGTSVHWADATGTGGVSSGQLAANLANYQTTAGLSANVAKLTANNTVYLNGIAANQYAYANAAVNFTAVASNIVPNTNLTYSLGNTTHKWHSLYVGTGSVYLGDARLSVENNKLNSSIGFSTDSLSVGNVDITVNGNGALVSSGGFVVGAANTATTANVANNASYLGGIAAAQYAYANQIVTTDRLTIRGTTVTLDNGANTWVGSVGGASQTAGLKGNSNTVFTLSGNGAAVMSLQTDGSIFAGDTSGNLTPMGVPGNYGGWIVAMSGIKSAYSIYANTTITAVGELQTNTGVRYSDNTYQTTAFSSSAQYNWSNTQTFSNTVIFNGNINVNGNTNYFSSNNIVYTDALIELHAPPGGVGNTWSTNDGNDIGLRFHYHNGSTDKNAGLILDNGTWRLKWIVDGTESTGQFSHTGYGDFEANTVYANLVGTTVTLSGNVEFSTNDTYICSTNTTTNTSITLQVNCDAPSASPPYQGVRTFIFGPEGGLTFPDNTTQYTAFTDNTSLTNDAFEFKLENDGSITFPTQTTVDWENGTLSGPTLRMGNDPSSQVIITGPAPNDTYTSAQRLIIQGQQGYGGENNTKGEGGDVYIWAGTGGEGGSIYPRGDGGDVKLRGGQGGNNGGYIRIESGDALAANGTGGFLDLNAGNANQTGGHGGNVNIRAGYGAGANQSGKVIIYTNNGEWTFGQDGTLSTGQGTVQRDISSVSCNHGVDTVVYTSTAHNRHTIKLLLNVEGNVVDNQSGWDTQSCEMIVTKSFRGPTVAATVYAVVHTSVAPLATFAAQWNATTSRVEVTCRPTSSTQDVYVKSFVTEITTSD